MLNRVSSEFMAFTHFSQCGKQMLVVTVVAVFSCATNRIVSDNFLDFGCYTVVLLPFIVTSQ